MKHKLENPERVARLNPPDTLRRIGLGGGDGFCDIGAGTGIFAFVAAEMTSNTVYAVEIFDDMLERLQSERAKRGLDNVIIAKGTSNVPCASCRIALLCTVLHELSDADAMIDEVKRILKPDGLLAVIEFHKKQTPLGPPLVRRLDAAHVAGMLTDCGMALTERFDLGENFYCLIFKREG